MQQVPDRPIKLSVFSTPAHLPVVRAAVEKACDLAGVVAEEIGKVVLSVDEALTNVIKHAYDGDEDQRIEVELTMQNGPDGASLRIVLTDWGRSVDPARIKSRELADVRPGGLGVHIIKESMDEVSYQPQPRGGTVLTMVKNIPGPAAG